ncbi:chromosome-anchoring protein RacA [Salibacterium halotolerans]|uniref:Chromosome-anchoring protein RacA n=2 Tax=Salibacterium halotolerans TaxID=1884432 RepID=A0A1I5Q9U1_9BACI|nr:chromosome-anchoring protein RacA [Salibacterium halotolerans]
MTEQHLKTKDIARRLEVSSSTVLNWVKKYNIPYTVNANGHYCFEEDTVLQFLSIKKQQQQDVSHTAEKSGGTVNRDVMLERLAQAEENVQLLERMIMNKADDIVTFQIVEQRKKIEALTKKMDRLEKQIQQQQDPELRRKQEDTAGIAQPGHLPAGLFQFE